MRFLVSAIPLYTRLLDYALRLFKDDFESSEQTLVAILAAKIWHQRTLLPKLFSLKITFFLSFIFNFTFLYQENF